MRRKESDGEGGRKRIMRTEKCIQGGEVRIMGELKEKEGKETEEMCIKSQRQEETKRQIEGGKEKERTVNNSQSDRLQNRHGYFLITTPPLP